MVDTAAAEPDTRPFQKGERGGPVFIVDDGLTDQPTLYKAELQVVQSDGCIMLMERMPWLGKRLNLRVAPRAARTPLAAWQAWKAAEEFRLELRRENFERECKTTQASIALAETEITRLRAEDERIRTEQAAWGAK